MGLAYADVELINSEDMGLSRRYMIDVLVQRNVAPPARQELIVNSDHPYYAQMKLKGIRG